jgi:two-component system, LytTR family, response regulator
MRALLVDDERLARAGLRRMLKAHDDVVVVGEAANAAEASAQLRRLQPDIVFLDVEMPGKSGLQLLEELDDLPPVIFTTAYQDYAVRAFEVSALDYLVKPISTERLAQALDKVRKSATKDKSTAHNMHMRQVFLREGDRCWIVAAEQIQMFESEGNYTRVYFEGHRPLIYKSLNALEDRLDASVFLRASRTHIVNLRVIKSLEAQPDGGLSARLAGGLTVAISRRQSRKLRALLSL